MEARRFQPLAIYTDLPRKEQLLVTDPNAGISCLLSLPEDVRTLSVSHVISGNDIKHLTDHLHFTDNIKFVTDKALIDMNNGNVNTTKSKKMIRESHLDIA